MELIVDENIKLIPYYPNYETTLSWYLSPTLCKQVDNIDFVYTLERLKNMYEYLSENGECYYIEYKGVLVGDVTLCNNKELAIVICEKYQNKHIGRKCIERLILRAKEKELDKVFAQIYSFNAQSEIMFKSLGFKKEKEELYVLELK